MTTPIGKEFPHRLSARNQFANFAQRDPSRYYSLQGEADELRLRLKHEFFN